MKCSEIDLISYLDGNAPSEVNKHIEMCDRCNNELKKLNTLLMTIPKHYAAGKRFEKELEESLATMDMNSLEELPPILKQKVAALKGNSLKERVEAQIKRVTGKAKEFTDQLMNPHMQAMPANPKDITKTKKQLKKKDKKLD